MQPSKNTIIPEGATHWNHGYFYPFEKHDENNIFYFIEGEWFLIEPKNYRKENAKLLIQDEIDYNSKPDVLTCYGEGKLIDKDGDRYSVELFDKNPLQYTPLYFMKTEIKTTKTYSETISFNLNQYMIKNEKSVEDISILTNISMPVIESILSGKDRSISLHEICIIEDSLNIKLLK